jgi:DNA-directed RNA polymerase specialized sigma24 family protein
VGTTVETQRSVTRQKISDLAITAQTTTDARERNQAFSELLGLLGNVIGGQTRKFFHIDPDDVQSEAHLALLEAVRTFQRPYPFVPWYVMTLRSRLVNHARSLSFRNSQKTVSLHSPAGKYSDCDGTHIIPDRRSTRLNRQLIARDDLASEIARLSLSEIEWDSLRARLQGLTYDETVTVYGITDRKSNDNSLQRIREKITASQKRCPPRPRTPQEQARYEEVISLLASLVQEPHDSDESIFAKGKARRRPKDRRSGGRKRGRGIN